ncbi:hypothetical protein HYDPIDRAFT_30876 [Hydnomerulius pinastri MD-312]|uniref:DUF6532 domain-containing protein n=1 Tax=Hydnomerulius pinastri MD-312 TaxID=994086 RepID=A0A0C9WCZ9_9AGAM|nr:hypothetical protein HYDPIDRAFT_30876 [Hydnomerulius pinastri MD-312]
MAANGTGQEGWMLPPHTDFSVGPYQPLSSGWGVPASQNDEAAILSQSMSMTYQDPSVPTSVNYTHGMSQTRLPSGSPGPQMIPGMQPLPDLPLGDEDDLCEQAVRNDKNLVRSSNVPAMSSMISSCWPIRNPSATSTPTPNRTGVIPHAPLSRLPVSTQNSNVSAHQPSNNPSPQYSGQRGTAPASFNASSPVQHHASNGNLRGTLVTCTQLSEQENSPPRNNVIPEPDEDIEAVDEDEEEVDERPKKRTRRSRQTEHQPHVRSARGLDSDTQKVLNIAYIHFKCESVTTNPFSDTQLDPIFGPEVHGLVKSRLSQMHGRIKDTARDFLISTYGFIPLHDCVGFSDNEIAQVKEKNRELVSQLLHKSAFAYHDPHNRNLPGTMYRQRLIAKIIVTWWFKNMKADGICYTSYFSALNVCLLAFILTAIECSIEEWSSGAHQNRDFDGPKYYPVFQRHLHSLENWQAYHKAEGAVNDPLKIVLDELLDIAK